MGSDSRTATATSSKPRPSWRDRHLSQLSDEQLNDVKKHRAASGSTEETGTDTSAGRVDSSDHASDSAAQLAGVDGLETATSQANRTPADDPRRQAGPDQLVREARYERSDDRARRNNYDSARFRDDAGSRERQGRSGQQESRRPLSDRERSEMRAPARHREPDRSRPDDRQWQYDDREYDRRSERSSGGAHREREVNRERRGQTRRGPVSREDEPQRNNYRHSSDAPTARRPQGGNVVSGSVAEQSVQAETTTAKKSIVNRLLDFKLSGPVKYGLMALAVAVMVAVSLMKPIDNSSQSQLDSALTRAMIGFGLARTLNGVISVAQGTEFAVQPAGVGVNFSPGEILDSSVFRG